MKNKLILFITILTAVAGLVGYWYYQRKVFSKEILKLEILGPREAELAQEVEYIVKYRNTGDVRLEEPRLIFEYPEHTIIEEGRRLRQETTLETIYPGEERTISFKGRLLGREDETKEARAWLSFRPINLKARYESATTFTTVIKKVPLTFEFDLPSKIESGEEIKFRLNYFSNVHYPLSNLRVFIEYPTDFEFLESNPRALEKTEWEIGLLNRAEGGRIEIKGMLRGEIGETQRFKSQLGSWQEGEFVLLKEAIHGVEIAEPSLFTAQQINGNPQYIANPGDLLHYEIFFRNIGPDALTNLVMIVRLEGEAFDFHSIKAPRGEFGSGANSIIWDGRRTPELRLLEVLEEGKVEFWIELKEEWEITGPEGKNPVIRNNVYLNQAEQEFVTKVNSKLILEQKGYFEDAARLILETGESRPERQEAFGNLGPIPPRAGETTTYTIAWHVKNYYNEMKNVKIKATLSENVRLTGKIFPEDVRLTFDSQSREVVWEIGDLEVGSGILTPAPRIAFQVAFTPTVLQKGQTSVLVGEAVVTGEDQWTGQVLEAKAPAIDTTLPDDPAITAEMGIIQ